MAVKKGSDNEFPSVLFAESTTPATPPSGDQRLFVDSADGLLKLVDDAGTVTAVGGASGLTDPMTTRGDIIVRNASNATARLAIGSSGKVLSSDGTDVSWQTPSAAAPSAHAVRAQRASGDVSVGNNTWTVIPFTAETYDTDTMHDNSTNPSRFTIPSISGVTTGLWALSARGYTNATTVRVDTQFRKNATGSSAGGTLIGVNIGGAISSSGVAPFWAYEECVLTAADYVELFVRTTGGSFNVVFEADDSPIFSMSFLGKVT